MTCHELRVFEARSSDDEVWIRLGRELPKWGCSGAVGPVSTDRLEECLGELDPRQPAAPTARKRARDDMRTTLDGVYHVRSQAMRSRAHAAVFAM
jgi:hypothetical protein